MQPKYARTWVASRTLVRIPSGMNSCWPRFGGAFFRVPTAPHVHAALPGRQPRFQGVVRFAEHGVSLLQDQFYFVFAHDPQRPSRHTRDGDRLIK
jgi:hypothetical protein